MLFFFIAVYNIVLVSALQQSNTVIHISNETDLKLNMITRDKRGYYIIIKGLIKEEDITIANIYASNIGTPRHIIQTLTNIKGEN